MEMKKEMEKRWNKRRDKVLKSRRLYRLQMLLAKPEEKERLWRERKNYVARTWYQAHREREAARRRERRREN